jgi:hypothetical protein
MILFDSDVLIECLRGSFAARTWLTSFKKVSPRNLGYMMAFAKAWTDEAILQQAAAKLPWFHNYIESVVS